MTKEIKEMAIPLLPCQSINSTIEFYKALGFEITYQQKVPNSYVAFRIHEIEIHFFALKQLQPEANFSSCYLVVKDVDSLYESFCNGLKSLFGKLPVKGFPRINPLKDMSAYGVRQFIVVDPAGNYIRIGQPIEKTDSVVFKEDGKSKKDSSPLEEAFELGSRLADGKDDLKTAAKHLDNVIGATTDPNAFQLLKVLVLRADVAAKMDDSAVVQEVLDKVDVLITQLDKKRIKEELRIVKEIRERIA